MQRASLTSLVLALGLAALVPGGVAAQEEAPQPKAPEAEQAKDAEKRTVRIPETRPKALLPAGQVRVQLVITRYQGDRKIGSAPYSFLVAVGERLQRTRVRMGVEAPIVMTTFHPTESGKTPQPSFQYKNVGTSIDCDAVDMGAGLYALHLGVENSSAYTASPTTPPEFALTGDRPLFRSFSVTLNPVLREGETIQTVASTDPVSGEVVKIDVTLNVVK